MASACFNIWSGRPAGLSILPEATADEIRLVLLSCPSEDLQVPRSLEAMKPPAVSRLELFVALDQTPVLLRFFYCLWQTAEAPLASCRSA